MNANGTIQTIDGKPVVTFERQLRHGIDTVWASLVAPDHLQHWFPTTIDGERTAGAKVDFRFREPDQAAWDFDGTITEYDPPKVFALRWGGEDLRFELTPDGDGTRLVFTATFDETGTVARDTAGWHVCLDLLGAHLAGEVTDAPTLEATPTWQQCFDHYGEAFGAEYAVTGAPTEP